VITRLSEAARDRSVGRLRNGARTAGA